jgi:YD repeat-containing protein
VRRTLAPDNLTLDTQPSTINHLFAYDSASRLSNVSYSYLANSPLISQITYRSNSTTRMTTSKSYDFLNRLSQISSAPSASSVVSFGYSYNDANPRTRFTLEDGSYWVYEYDYLGQLTSGETLLGGRNSGCRAAIRVRLG